LKLKLPNPLKAVATWLEALPVAARVGAVVGATSIPPPWARILDEGPNAVPSAENVVLEYNVPVISEAYAKEEEASMNISNKNDFNNI
jgi:hypothetical protein